MDIEKLLEGKLDEVFKFRQSLNDETDRGCSLMAAAYLDYELGELLRGYFVDKPQIVKQMLDNNGPLTTFSSRIELSYLLGLIGEQTRRDLNLIRKIRNEFAHTSNPISFETESIRNRCLELHFDPSEETRTRQKFTRVVLGVLAIIHTKILLTEHRKSPADA